jgi:hypothetical protein
LARPTREGNLKEFKGPEFKGPEFKGPVPKRNLKGLSLKIELTGAEVETDCLSV